MAIGTLQASYAPLACMTRRGCARGDGARVDSGAWRTVTDDRRPPEGGRRNAAFAAVVVVVVAISIQTGSALAVRVIESVGVVEALWLRTAFAALILVASGRRAPTTPAEGPPPAARGTRAGALLDEPEFLRRDQPVPVGIVVAIEFVGPLDVVVLGTRRKLDWLWIVLAGVGVVVLAGPSGSATGLGVASGAGGRHLLGHLPSAGQTRRDRHGPALGHGADDGRRHHSRYSAARDRRRQADGSLGRRRARHRHRHRIVGLPLPAGDGGHPPRPRRHLRRAAQTIEPAVAALAALIVLGQRISLVEGAAMAAVMAAAAGASWTSGGAAEAGVDLPAP